jgi:hypothetical protein
LISQSRGLGDVYKRQQRRAFLVEPTHCFWCSLHRPCFVAYPWQFVSRHGVGASIVFFSSLGWVVDVLGIEPRYLTVPRGAFGESVACHTLAWNRDGRYYPSDLKRAGLPIHNYKFR